MRSPGVETHGNTPEALWPLVSTVNFVLVTIPVLLVTRWPCWRPRKPVGFKMPVCLLGMEEATYSGQASFCICERAIISSLAVRLLEGMKSTKSWNLPKAQEPRPLLLVCFCSSSLLHGGTGHLDPCRDLASRPSRLPGGNSLNLD